MTNAPSVSTTRDPGIDLVKIVAMVMVVTMHVTFPFPNGILTLTRVLYYSCTPAIPLFFMVSGFLLLPRAPSSLPLTYVPRKIWAIIRLCILAVLIYYAIYNALGVLHSGLINYFKRYIIYNSILWFLIAMAAVYLFYPVLNRLWRHPKAYIAVLVLLGTMSFGAFVLDIFYDFEARHIIQYARLWYWLFYFMLGGLLHRLTLSRRALWTLLTVSATAMYLQDWFIAKNVFLEFDYGSPVTILLAVAIFGLCRHAGLAHHPAVKFLSTLFLPVYILHLPVLEAILKCDIDWNFSGSCVCLILLTLAVTVGISRLIMRTRVGRWIFHL